MLNSVELYIILMHVGAVRTTAFLTGRLAFRASTTPYSRNYGRINNFINRSVKDLNLSIQEFDARHGFQAGERPQTLNCGSSDGGNGGNGNNINRRPVSESEPENPGNLFQYFVPPAAADTILMATNEIVAVWLTDLVVINAVITGGFGVSALTNKDDLLHKWSGLALEPLYRKIYYYFYLALWLKDRAARARFLEASIVEHRKSFEHLDDVFKSPSNREEIQRLEERISNMSSKEIDDQLALLQKRKLELKNQQAQHLQNPPSQNKGGGGTFCGMVLFPDQWDLQVQRFNEANANKLFKKQGVSKCKLNLLTLFEPQDQQDFLISTTPEVDKLKTFSYSPKAKMLTISGEQNEVSLKTDQKLLNLQEQPEGSLNDPQNWSSDSSSGVPSLLESQDLLTIKQIDPLYKLKNYDVDHDFYAWVKSFPLTSADLLEEETSSEMFVLHSQRIGISSHLKLDNQKPLAAISHAQKQCVVQKKFNFFETQINEINLP
jgi:hypothetical protein